MLANMDIGSRKQQIADELGQQSIVVFLVSIKGFLLIVVRVYKCVAKRREEERMINDRVWVSHQTLLSQKLKMQNMTNWANSCKALD